jgi:hypothetical protein
MAAFRLHRYIPLVITLLLVPLGADARTPNDPLVRQWSYSMVDAFRAWDSFTGSKDVVVAVVDNGFDSFHPDLEPNLWRNTDEIANNGLDDDNNGYIDDVHGWNFVPTDLDGDGRISGVEHVGSNDPRPNVGQLTQRQKDDEALHHGTAVAGIIGAVGNNRIAGSGINWNVRLMNLKVLATDGDGSVGPLANAIRYAVDNGADVINISLVGQDNENVVDAVKYAYDHDVVVVAAAGNNRVVLDISPLQPVCADAHTHQEWVIGVTAIQEDRFHAPFANYGSSCIDIAAPGVNVSSTARYAPRHGLTSLYRSSYSGTSFASPFVAGAAALLKGIQPQWGPEEIYTALTKTTSVTPPDDPELYEALFGAGLLKIDQAVSYALGRRSSPEHALKGIAVVGSDGVLAHIKHDGSSKESTVEQLRAILGATTVHGVRETYATAAYNSIDSVVTIRTYNGSWRELRSWSFRSLGPVSLVSGDVVAGQQHEIIAISTASSKTLATVFDLHGNKIRTIDADEVHRGAAGMVNKRVDRSVLVLAYGSENGVTIAEYESGILSNSFHSSRLTSVSAVTAGDLDGDDGIEYAIAGGSRDPGRLMFLDQDGKTLRKFYSAGRHKDVRQHLLIMDVDGNGIGEVVASSNEPGKETRAWSVRGKVVQSWQPFTSDKTLSIGLLGLYQ